MMAERIYGLDTETDNDGHTAWMVQWAIVDADGHGWCGTEYDDLKARICTFFDLPGKTLLYIQNINYDIHFIKGIIAEICQEFSIKAEYIIRYGSVISVTLRPT